MAFLVFVSSAQATAPAGVHQEQRLEPPASWIAEKPVTVYCGDDVAAWPQVVARLAPNLRPTVGAFASAVGGDEEYLAPQFCNALLAWPHAWLNSYALGGPLLTLIHEAVHLRGIRDESLTDCTALAAIASVAVRWFVTRNIFENMVPWLLREVEVGAWGSHYAAPPEYRTLC